MQLMSQRSNKSKTLRNCRTLRWEVIVTKNHVVFIVVIVFGEQAFLAQEIVGFQNHWLTDLQREDVVVTVSLHKSLRNFSFSVHSCGSDHKFSLEILRRVLQPLLTIQHIVLFLWDIGDNSKLLRPSREDGFANVPGASFALLVTLDWNRIHRIQGLHKQLHVSLRLVDGTTEELQAAHV